MPSYLDFEPEDYRSELIAILTELARLDEFDAADLQRVLRGHPKDGRGLFSKSELVRGLRRFGAELPQALPGDGVELLDRLRMKPVRTLSGVAPVTVLTKPFPCPGRCIFCPSDVRMPKSYLSDEPGAQRAAQHQFDPFLQTLARLLAYHHNGHPIDKIELIVLGGTWSSYDEDYQVWFLKRCFDALNTFSNDPEAGLPGLPDAKPAVDFRRLDERVNGRNLERSYNQVVSDFVARRPDASHAATAAAGETATWQELEAAQRVNESARARCVGLSLETRPDHLTLAEAVRMRRLGATKVQIGYQSLDDEVLAANRRGHDVAAVRASMAVLRQTGFKIHAHWMPNLHGSTPEHDLEDFERLFADPDFRPDELKIYPCSLIESAELMAYFERGDWRPYTHEELLEVLSGAMLRTPRYCRLTRIIRDIPGTDIVAGNRLTNFRELAEEALDERGLRARDIRAREVRATEPDPDGLSLRVTEYATGVGSEQFLELVTPDDRLAAFLRLSLPAKPVPIPEIAIAAMVRELHVYGRLLAVGERRFGPAQHSGLGARLLAEAERRAAAAGFPALAVISSIGTREYYRRRGFGDGVLYQSKPLEAA